MFSEGERISKYFDLEANRKKGYNIKFPYEDVVEEHRFIGEICEAIVNTRDKMNSSFFKESYDFHKFFCKERLECNKTEEKYDNQSRKNANYKFYASCANSMHFTFCRRSCKFKLNSDYKS